MTSVAKPLIAVALIYLLVVSIGLYVGLDLVEKIREGEIPPAVPNPESPESSVWILVNILVMTAVILALLKLNFNIIIQALVAVAMFTGMLLTLDTFIGYYSLPAAVILMLLSFWRKNNILLMNATLVLTIAGIGAFLGASLSLIPSLLLLVSLSVYDFIAVFWTKHMVTLAEKLKEKIPFMFIIPVEEGKNMGLGTGDLAMPLMFTVSVLRDHSIGSAILTAVGGLIALMFLMNYVARKEHTALPALPPLCLGLLAGFAVSLIFSSI